MHVWPNIKALQSISTSLLLLLIALGFAVPSQATTIGAVDAPHINSTMQGSKAHIDKHQPSDDCCDVAKTCPADMDDCGIDCVAHGVGAIGLLKPYSANYLATRLEMSRPLDQTALAYFAILDGPPPRS